ncbi:UNVERIFIED_ORG: DUF1515 domain-containing protein [Roseateles sp. XES5]|nr:DUF1515 family protein [Roseateles sp. XES5]
MIDGSVHQQLGMLLAEVKNLREDFRRSEDKSDASRASMHRRMDDLVERVGTLEGAMTSVKEDVTEMRPVTEEVRRWKIMGLGALGATGIAFMALGVTFADAIRRVGEVVFGR